MEIKAGYRDALQATFRTVQNPSAELMRTLCPHLEPEAAAEILRSEERRTIACPPLAITAGTHLVEFLPKQPGEEKAPRLRWERFVPSQASFGPDIKVSKRSRWLWHANFARETNPEERAALEFAAKAWGTDLRQYREQTLLEFVFEDPETYKPLPSLPFPLNEQERIIPPPWTVHQWRREGCLGHLFVPLRWQMPSEAEIVNALQEKHPGKTRWQALETALDGENATTDLAEGRERAAGVRSVVYPVCARCGSYIFPDAPEPSCAHEKRHTPYALPPTVEALWRAAGHSFAIDPNEARLREERFFPGFPTP